MTARAAKNFRRTFDTRVLPFFGASHKRRAASLAAVHKLQGDVATFADFAKILRSHHRAVPSGNRDLCMHAAPSHSPWRFLRPSHTVNAMIVRIDSNGPLVTFTGTASSCVSLFRPVDFHGEWSLCDRDLWERHKVWLEHREARGVCHGELQGEILAAEREIFTALETADLHVAEQRARFWAGRIYQ